MMTTNTAANTNRKATLPTQTADFRLVERADGTWSVLKVSTGTYTGGYSLGVAQRILDRLVYGF